MPHLMPWYLVSLPNTPPPPLFFGSVSCLNTSFTAYVLISFCRRPLSSGRRLAYHLKPFNHDPGNSPKRKEQKLRNEQFLKKKKKLLFFSFKKRCLFFFFLPVFSQPGQGTRLMKILCNRSSAGCQTDSRGLFGGHLKH